jgi:cytidylate kinase
MIRGGLDQNLTRGNLYQDMNAQAGLERCLSFINCQLQPGGKFPEPSRNGSSRRAVTISRQTGSGGHSVAERLAEYLQEHAAEGSCPWAIFDRNLVEKVIEEHNLPKRLARFMPEDRISEISDTMDELFGLHPPSWTLVRQMADSILRLAQLGNVIIIGRGASVITARLESVFHVRLVGSIEKRADSIQQLHSLSRKAALKFIQNEDRGRKRYLKKYFDRDIDDPLLYHLIINTDLVSFDEAARMIGDAVLGQKALEKKELVAR